MRLKLEHRKQRVATIPRFIARLGRYSVLSLLLILISLLLGTLGYRNFQGLTWLDSFYMASMILTGMGPIAEMTSDKAKLFSSIYALYSGIAFLSTTAIFFVPIIHRLLHILHVEKDDDRS